MSGPEPQNDSQPNDENRQLTIPLGPVTSIDLSQLDEPQRKALINEHLRGQIEVNRKAQELAVEAKSLEATLGIMADSVNDVASKENSITLTHTQTSSVGRTEVLMGNTSQAQRGKLTKSQTGQTDWTPLFIGGGLFAAFIVVLAVILGQ